jgi:hypothetical protein
MPSDVTATPKKVLVLGAGMSGIAAGKFRGPRQSTRLSDFIKNRTTLASLLARAGVDVTVLEARDRTGGRTYTVDFPTPSGPIPIDLGGSWIHGVTNPEFIVRGLYKGKTHQVKSSRAFHPRDHEALSVEKTGMLQESSYLPYAMRVPLIQKIKKDKGQGPDGDGKNLDVTYRQIWDEAFEERVKVAGATTEREKELVKLSPECESLLAIDLPVT